MRVQLVPQPAAPSVAATLGLPAGSMLEMVAILSCMRTKSDGRTQYTLLPPIRTSSTKFTSTLPSTHSNGTAQSVISGLAQKHMGSTWIQERIPMDSVQGANGRGDQ